MVGDYFLALGGGNEIGASCYLLSLGPVRLLIDAGMRLNADRAFPDFSRLTEAVGGLPELDAFLLTHSHLDHCGALTRVQHDAPYVPKYATRPTLDLAKVILRDALRSSHGQHGEDWHVVEATRRLLDESISSFVAVEFGQAVPLEGSGATITAFRAGHILGAASYLIECAGRTVLHTGDVSLHAQRTIPGSDIDSLPSQVDVLVIESTYAYQPEYHTETVEEQQMALVEMVARAVRNEGRVLIPAFALGRAQEVASLFGEYFEQGLVQPFPVRLDGLVKPITEVYDRHRKCLQGRLQVRGGHSLYDQNVRPMPGGFYPSTDSIRQLEPMCIIASSGMLLDGTRSASYAEALLGMPRDAVIFSGYLDDESPGKRLLALENAKDKFRVNGHSVDVRAQVSRYHLSAHAPSLDLRRLIRIVRPQTVIFVHGDYRYSPEAEFVDFMMEMEQKGIHFQQAANGIPIYL